jgi:hypothetical protein
LILLKPFMLQLLHNVERMEDIVGLIFKYLHLLKEDGVHEWIFNEVMERVMVYILSNIIFNELLIFMLCFSFTKYLEAVYCQYRLISHNINSSACG